MLRERIANFEAAAQERGRRRRADAVAVAGISINDLRKNLRDLNEHMDRECASQARYGIPLDASLITGIDPPPDVESALAAINTAHNQVSSRHQPGPGLRRPEDRAVQAGGGDRDAEGAGRSRAAAAPWPSSSRSSRQSGPGAWTPTCAMSGLGLFSKANRVIAGGASNEHS